MSVYDHQMLSLYLRYCFLPKHKLRKTRATLQSHHIERTPATAFGRLNRLHAPRSKTFTASRNSPNSKIPKYIFGQATNARQSKTCTAPQRSKHQNYIFPTSEQCPVKQNMYAPQQIKNPNYTFRMDEQFQAKQNAYGIANSSGGY